MSGISKEIVDWLHQQQDWLQESAELLHQAGALSDAEVARLATRLQTEEGRKVTTSRPFEWFASHSLPMAELRLASLGDIQGIENLAPRMPLDFGTGNLTVIYGPNGSGKSSYTRILKKACGKPRAQALKSNVFQAPPAHRQCSIRFRSGGKEQTVVWAPDGKAIAALQAADFFDADAASSYLSKEAEASYTPPTIALFEGLASACDRVKAKLQGDQDLLVSILPSLPQDYLGTGAGTAYKSLKANLSEAAIECLTKWGDSDQATLDQLVERLNVADPALSAKQKRATKVQMDKLQEEMNSAESVLRAEQIHHFRAARKEAQEKRKMATEAAKANAQFSLLEGVGTDTWGTPCGRLHASIRRFRTHTRNSQSPVLAPSVCCAIRNFPSIPNNVCAISRRLSKG